MIFDDISIRQILQVKKYDYVDIKLDHYYEKNKIPYFYNSNTEIVVGFFIPTIVDWQWIPVISMKDIRHKLQLKKELFLAIPKLKEKGRKTLKNILLLYTDFPLELIILICSFY